MYIKERITVLIAENNYAFRTSLVETLEKYEDMHVIGSVSSAEAALNIIVEQKPDIAVLDVLLPGNDGLWVLEELAKLKEYSTSCIMLSSFDDDSIAKIAVELGAKYYIIKPVSCDVLARRIRQMKSASIDKKDSVIIQKELLAVLDDKNSVILEKDSNITERKIANMLNRLGISASIKGYHYLRSSILKVIADENAIIGITKRVYPDVAKEFKSSSSKVERAIRHAIDSAWKKDNGNSYHEIFGGSNDKRPTNGQFIATIAEFIKLEDFSKIPA